MKNKKKLMSGVLALSMLSSVINVLPATGYAAETPKLNKIEYRDAAGNVIDSAAGSEHITAEVTFNPVGENTSANIYLAVYSGDGRLVKADTQKAQLVANGLKQSFVLEADGITDGQYADVFVWDQNQTPLDKKFDSSEIKNVRIDGNPSPYDTLEGRFQYSGDRSKLTYKWLYSSSENGEYTEVSNTYNDDASKLTLLRSDYKQAEYTVYNTSTSDSVTVNPIIAGDNVDLEGKYVKFSVTDESGTSYTSEPVRINDSWGGKELYNGQTVDGAREQSDSDYIFTVDGQKFILLDTIESDDDGRYLVMSYDTYGGRQYYMSDQGQRPFEIANWLNTTFKANGNENRKLPDSIINNIDYDRYWRVEQGSWWHVPNTFAEDGRSYRHISVKGGIMIPAYSELVQYKDIVGLHDTNANWWLRSPCAKQSDGGNQADGNWVTRIKDSGNDIAGTHGREAAHNLRLIFALDKDFFKNVKLEWAGAKVAERIRTDVSYQNMLAAGYSEVEIRNMLSGKSSIQSVSMDGIFEYYQTVKANVTFSDGVDGSDVTGTWLISDSEDGEYTEIEKDNYVTDSQITLVQGCDEVIDNTYYTDGEAFLLKGNNFIYEGKWLKYRAALNGEIAESDAKKIESKWNDETYYSEMTADDTYVAESPAENKFTVDGQEFVLLKTTDSSTSHYYIAADKTYLDEKKGESQRVEPMALWLNSDFKTGGYLPDSILNEIDYNHYWIVAPRYWERSSSGLWKPAVKGGIGLLSRAEYIEYKSKLGYAATDSTWWLYDPATAHGMANGNNVLCVNGSNGDIQANDITGSARGIRPTFYVNKDFFAKVKITKAGENVVNQAVADCNEDALKKLYGSDDYISYMTGSAAESDVIVPVMKGIYEYYQTIKGEVINNDKNNEYDMSTAEYSWRYSDSENGKYNEIPKSEYVTDTQITLVQGVDNIEDNAKIPGSFLIKGGSAAYAGKWLKYCVTVGNTTFSSEPRKIGEKWSDEDLYKSNDPDSTYVANSPEENLFSKDGQEFILLDTTESDTAHYFVMGREQYLQTHKGEGQRAETMANWLNSTAFKNNLPQEILDNIDYDNYWTVAPEYWGRSNNDIWLPAVKCGISLLGYREYIKYHEKIGYSDDNITDWWLRDSAFAISADGNGMLKVIAATGKTASANITTDSLGIRPVFYLNKDFFKNVKVTDVGENVKNLILADVSESELKTLYGDNYLDAMGKTKYDVAVKGICETGELLTVSSDSLDLSNASYIWYYSDKKTKGYSEAATTASFTTDEKYAGKYVKASVTIDGKTYETAPVKIGILWTDRQDNTTIANVKKTTPAEYVFTAYGKQYILLNETTSDKSRFLIMSKDSVKNSKATDNGYESQIFSLDADTLGNWLNDGYLNSLPTEIKRSINLAQNWKLDIPMWNTETEMSVTAGVVTPAVNEIKKYKDKIGFGELETWWTRSPFGIRGGDGNYIMCVSYDGENAQIEGQHCTSYADVRPMFYVDKDFFNKVKLTSAGSEVLKVMTKSSLYTDSEWEELNGQTKEGVFFNIPAEIANDGTSTLSVELDIARGNGAEYTIEYTCGNYSNIITKNYSGNVSENVELSLDTLPNGVNDVTISVKRNGNIVATATKTISVYTPYSGNVNGSVSLNGFCSFIGYDGSELLDKAVASGMNVNRVALTWDQIEDGEDGRGRGDYDWEEMDANIMPILENGIDPIIILSYKNSLYDDSTCDNHGKKYGSSSSGKEYSGLMTKDIIDGLAAYGKAVAQHYKDKGYELKYFEFWNEPNTGSFYPSSLGHKFYSDAAAVATNEIKKVLPNAVMINGALAHNDPAWMKYMVNTGYYSAGAFSYHPYTVHYTYRNYVDDVDMYGNINDMNKVQLSYGGWKQNWITEYGVSTWNNANYGNSEDKQASEYVKERVIADSAYTDANINYCFRNTGNKASEFEDNFGAVEANAKIKPAYISSTTASQNLSGAVYLGEIDSSLLGNANAKMYVYAREGKFTAVAWNKNSDNASVSLSGENVTVYDMYNNKLTENASEITFGNDPVYITNLSAKWANIALSASILKVIRNNCEQIAVNTDFLTDVITGANEISQKTDIANVDSNIEAVYSAVNSVMSADWTQTQKSAALYTVHQLGTMLLKYKMMTNTAGTDTISDARLESVSAAVKAKEDAVIGGQQTYTDSMLAIARKYIDFAKSVKNAEETSEYKNAIVNAYNTIAEEILDMAEIFTAAEDISADKLLVQVPVLETSLVTTNTVYSKGEINVSVYNYGNKDIDSGTLTLLKKDGSVFAKEVEFSCKAGETTVVKLSYTAGVISSLESYAVGSYKQYYATAVVKNNGTEVKNTLIPLNADAGDGLFKE